MEILYHNLPTHARKSEQDTEAKGIRRLRQIKADLIRPVRELSTFPTEGKALEEVFTCILLHGDFVTQKAVLQAEIP